MSFMNVVTGELEIVQLSPAGDELFSTPAQFLQLALVATMISLLVDIPAGIISRAGQ